MNDAMVAPASLLALHAAHPEWLRHRTEAVIDRSALAFNRPRIHDNSHRSAAFVHWRHWTNQAPGLKSHIDDLEHETAGTQLARDCGAGGVT